MDCFGRAQQAAEESRYRNAEEKVKLAVMGSYGTDGNLDNELLKENVNSIDGLKEKVADASNRPLNIIVDGYPFTIGELGEVTGERELAKGNAGEEVPLKEGWGEDSVRYYKTEDGTEIKEITKEASVTAISGGNGDIVPVPKQFYYVGGTTTSGVVISDNEADKDKYKGQEDVGKDLQGNQFVWIPCIEKEYVKTDWGNTYQNANWDNNIYTSEKIQIQKYGGFYVGRYEAGLADTIEEYTEAQKHTGSNQVYNLKGIPQSKSGVIPWSFIDYITSKANAENMYSNNKYVSSGLITGTQWDVMLNTIVNKTDLDISDLKDSSKWGNYRNNSIEYNGRKANAYLNGNWYLEKFENEEKGTTTNNENIYQADLLTTGASETTEKYNIYDVAGNVWEWTEEDSHYSISEQYRVFRGGTFIDPSGTWPACFRQGSCTVNSTSPDVGFRVSLYIK